MSLAHLVSYARTIAPQSAAALGWRWLRRRAAAGLGAARDRGRETYAALRDDGSARLATYVPELPAALLTPLADRLAAFAGRAVEHRFNVLGSGWVRVEPGMDCAGFAGTRYASPLVAADGRRERAVQRLSPGNRARAGALWRLAGDGYRPLDWQLDVRSGYRWSEADWHGAIAYGHEPGVDIKVPWELARLQHLPQLALAFVLARAGGPAAAPAETYRDAVRDQAVDFLACNPPRFGVNWASPMEVAIRAANLLLATDLLRRHGADLDARFLAEVEAAAWAHGRHVARHLDWHPERRGNHFLVETAGLAFIAAYVERTPESDAWLAFAVRHLIAETERQFGADGAHFEASTSYHRFAAEAVLYATALVAGLPAERMAALAEYDHRQWRGPGPLAPAPVSLHPVPGTEGRQSPFPAAHFERLARMARFTADITKPGGRVVQIGDNDSGRFIEPVPACRRTVGDDAPVEDPLDHRHLVAAIGGLTGGDGTQGNGVAGALEAALVRGLAGGVTAAVSVPAAPAALAAQAEDTGAAEGPMDERKVVIELPDGSVLDGLTAAAYPDFGLYVWRGPRLFLSVRCGPADRDGLGAHAHNDQLAIELSIDGVDWAADPGTYVYTAAPEIRNAYRSVAAHAAPRLEGREPGRLDQGPFRLADRAEARCLRFDAEGFQGVHVGFGVPVERTVSIGGGRITVLDRTGIPEPGRAPRTERAVARSAAELKALLGLAVAFSPGYGLRLAEGPNSGNH